MRVLCEAQGGISPGVGAQRALAYALSAEHRIISLLVFPFIDFPLKNVPVTDEKLEKYGGDGGFYPIPPISASFTMHQVRWGVGPSQTFILSQML